LKKWNIHKKRIDISLVEMERIWGEGGFPKQNLKIYIVSSSEA
jgi:hypothetical protein